MTSVDVTGRLLHLAAEAGAGVQSPVDADGVGMSPMDLARTHVNTIRSLEPVLARLLLPVPAPALVMHAPLNALPPSPMTVSGIMPFGALTSGMRMIGLKLIFEMFSAKSCSARK